MEPAIIPAGTTGQATYLGRGEYQQCWYSPMAGLGTWGNAGQFGNCRYGEPYFHANAQVDGDHRNGWNMTSDGMVSVPLGTPGISTYIFSYTIAVSGIDQQADYVDYYTFTVTCMSVDIVATVLSQDATSYLVSCEARPIGGVAPYAYTWSGGGTLVSGQGTAVATFSFLLGTSGTVSVSVTDSSPTPCSGSASANVSQSGLTLPPGPGDTGCS